MKNNIPEPDWLHKHPKEWPPEIHTFWFIVLNATKRRLEAEQQQGA